MFPRSLLLFISRGPRHNSRTINPCTKWVVRIVTNLKPPPPSRTRLSRSSGRPSALGYSYSFLRRMSYAVIDTRTQLRTTRVSSICPTFLATRLVYGYSRRVPHSRKLRPPNRFNRRERRALLMMKYIVANVVSLSRATRTCEIPNVTTIFLVEVTS